MSYINFGCKYCRKTSLVSASRLMHAHFIRCDSCFAVNALSESQRIAMIQHAASPQANRFGADRGHKASLLV
jgi:flavin reductase (DIM6/NTAB) family NADH-FMN oxidoreductase RutF